MYDTCLIYGIPVENLPFGYDEKDELCIKMKLKIAQLVSELAVSGTTHYVTDCEFGVPLWGAEIVLAQKIYNPQITLTVYMPHEEQAVKWASDWRDRYFSVHENADKVVTLKDYDICIDELCNGTDVLIYAGENSTEVLERFYRDNKTVHRINF